MPSKSWEFNNNIGRDFIVEICEYIPGHRTFNLSLGWEDSEGKLFSAWTRSEFKAIRDAMTAALEHSFSKELPPNGTAVMARTSSTSSTPMLVVGKLEVTNDGTRVLGMREGRIEPRTGSFLVDAESVEVL